MEGARILAYITGIVDQELLLRNEYLAAENRILKGRLRERLRLSDGERRSAKSATDWAARCSARWRLPLCRKPSWGGTGDLSLANSMDRVRGEPRAGPWGAEMRSVMKHAHKCGAIRRGDDHRGGVRLAVDRTRRATLAAAGLIVMALSALMARRPSVCAGLGQAAARRA
jgi:hypothetical protein